MRRSFVHPRKCDALIAAKKLLCSPKPGVISWTSAVDASIQAMSPEFIVGGSS